MLTNYYTSEFKSCLMSRVDCVLSCGTSRYAFACDGKPARMERVEMFGTSMPVYIGAYACNERLHFDVYSRTFELNVGESTPFALDRLASGLPT